jgi:hypothetical protein
MANRNDTTSPQSGGDRNWEKTAERVKDAPEATGKVSRGADEFATEDDRSKQPPPRTEIDRNVKK